MRNARPIAIALFDETDVPSVEEFVSRHKATWEDEDPPRTVQKQGESAVIAVGEDQFTFAAFRKPFAWSSLEGPCSTAWWWHNAADEIRSHGSHVVIMPLEDPFDQVDVALDLTRLARHTVQFKTAAAFSGRLVRWCILRTAFSSRPRRPPRSFCRCCCGWISASHRMNSVAITFLQLEWMLSASVR
ncbi:MAG: hypothetical protein U5N86_04565 [Planctomycetota bacterium]|nr:hypothetical protein [Planctomycetota bacterium]